MYLIKYFGFRLLVILTLILTVPGAIYALDIKVYRKVALDLVTARASSSIESSPASNVVDGSCMNKGGHAANNQGEGMWVSEPADGLVRYCPDTHEGAVWFLCELKSAMKIDRVCIWNHNQNEHTRRGFNKVYIEYSSDGRKWELLKDGDSDYHLFPESIGRNPEPADYVLEFNGKNIKYLLLTAANEGGNHYDMSNPLIRLETMDMHQNPKYFGLAEIVFLQQQKVDLQALPALTDLTFVPSQGYLKTENGPSREFRVDFDNPLYADARLDFDLGGKKWSVDLPSDPQGRDSYDGLFPPGYMEESMKLKVGIQSPQGNLQKEYDVPAARKWTVNFFSHSHLDIGYTHRQMDVMKLQWRNFERAMDLAERTKDYPEGARYCWNTEATWPLAGYLQEYAGTEKAERIVKAIKDGVINVDAPLGSILTGISRQEELMHIFDDAHKIAELTGVECNTAMMSDVPGQVWGFATALAKNGVRYYSPGPNYVPFYGRIGNDRAAALHVKWGDKPFWWQSQSGTDKVLVWQAGRGYSWFHGWLAGRLSVCGLDPIWHYLTELEVEEFPYNTCYLRYTVHGDNGPPDEKMPDVIREWNEKYDSPQFRISTTKEFFESFEKEYGDRLPVYGGDMTPTWEDGAASTARETSTNRESAARLAQTQILWTMLKQGNGFPTEDFSQAWKNVILFSEHTWGAAASGPQPYSKFTMDLWNGKKMYADSANVQSERLMAAVLDELKGDSEYIQVLNTNLWPRTDVVIYDDSALFKGMRLLNHTGDEVPYQILSDGRCVFVAEDVPAMSSAVYRLAPVTKKHKATEYKTMANANVLDNGLVRVVIDPKKGTISSFKTSKDDYEYASASGLNDYLYTARIGKDPRGIDGVNSIEIIDNGPVAAAIRVISDAPGCNSLTRDVIIYRGLDRVDIVNTVDKKDILEFENVRFVFPFNFSHPDITMDLAMSEIHPEREQLAGVNKHYYSVQNGLSVGDLEHGICMTTIDAPFVELGTPSGEDYRLNPRYGYGWWPMAQISPVVYSWVMTNTWRTNYKASQGGVTVYRYSLQADNPFDLKLKQKGLEAEQKMLVLNTTKSEPVENLFRLKGRNRIALSSIVPSKDGEGYIVCLHNMGSQSVQTGFIWGILKGNRAALCDWKQEPLSEINPEDFWMKPYEYMMLKISTTRQQ